VVHTVVGTDSFLLGYHRLIAHRAATRGFVAVVFSLQAPLDSHAWHVHVFTGLDANIKSRRRRVHLHEAGDAH